MLRSFGWSVGLGLVLPMVAAAHAPELVSLPSQHDDVLITAPQTEIAYYGDLAGWPHTYRFTLNEPTTIALNLKEPVTKAGSAEVFSVIVVRDVASGVEEVARLLPAEAAWERTYDGWSGDHYYQGGSYQAELSAGTYKVEVSSPDNIGRYVLTLGTETDRSGLLATWKGVYEVKRWFGKPTVAVFQSPFYYVPALLLVIGFFWYRRQKRW